MNRSGGNYTHMSKHRITASKTHKKPFNGARSRIACDGHPEERRRESIKKEINPFISRHVDKMHQQRSFSVTKWKTK